MTESDNSVGVLSVAELSRRLRRVLEGLDQRSWVEGEVASFKRAASGHIYFSLKDEREDALVECVMYRAQARLAERFLSDGARIQVLGKATLWAPRGRMQFIIERARPAGRGAVLEALERLKASLAAEGLFDPSRKRPLPPEPRRIGLVTSAAGAVLHDIVAVAFRRGGARLLLAPALVQGEGAPDSLLAALTRLESVPDVDVVIIGRGGGSGEDLMAFNDERVVRKVAAMRVPIVSAVGHDVDYSLTDLAADLRAATPSQAAELVVADGAERLSRLQKTRAELVRMMERRLAEDQTTLHTLSRRLPDPRFQLAQRQQRLDELRVSLESAANRLHLSRRPALASLSQRLATRHPRAVLAECRGALGPLVVQLRSSEQNQLMASTSQLAQAAVRLNALSPLSILGRGYSIATRPDGRAVRTAREVEVGDILRLRLGEGTVVAEVCERECRSGEGG